MAALARLKAELKAELRSAADPPSASFSSSGGEDVVPTTREAPRPFAEAEWKENFSRGGNARTNGARYNKQAQTHFI